MAHRTRRNPKTLSEKYPPSEPCCCKICLTYCLCRQSLLIWDGCKAMMNVRRIFIHMDNHRNDALLTHFLSYKLLVCVKYSFIPTPRIIA